MCVCVFLYFNIHVFFIVEILFEEAGKQPSQDRARVQWKIEESSCFDNIFQRLSKNIASILGVDQSALEIVTDNTYSIYCNPNGNRQPVHRDQATAGDTYTKHTKITGI